MSINENTDNGLTLSTGDERERDDIDKTQGGGNIMVPVDEVLKSNKVWVTRLDHVKYLILWGKG